MAGLHLVRRGAVYWWRRRVPAALRRSRGCDSAGNPPLSIADVVTSADAQGIRCPTHLSISLRTSCPREARRRATRVTALCDYAWSLAMSTMNATGPVPHPWELAGGLLSLLDKGLDAYTTTLACHSADPVARARDEIRAEAALKSEMLASVAMPAAASLEPAPVPPAREPDRPSPHTLFLKTDIGVLNARNTALAEQCRALDEQSRTLDEIRARGTDLEHVLGRIESHLRPKEAQQPAASPAPYTWSAVVDDLRGSPEGAGSFSGSRAMPGALTLHAPAQGRCDAQDAATTSTSTDAGSAGPAEPAAALVTADAANAESGPETDPDAGSGPGAAAVGDPVPGGREALDPDRISVLFGEWLDLRCEGYALEREKETPSPADGESFRQTSRKNIESTHDILVDVFGDIRPDQVTDTQIEDWIKLLRKIPRYHGKSSRERRGMRAIVEDTERKEKLAVLIAKQAAKELGASAGNIEAAGQDALIPRLGTATCVRHMRDASRILDYWVGRGRIARNPLKDYLWTTKEIELRLAREADRERRPWGGKLAELLATPLFVAGPEDPGDPLFWAPLIAELQGLRMEEVLQLGPGDVEEEQGILVLRVQITNAAHRLKTKNAKRTVPVHRTLIELGFLELVAERRRKNERRLFPHVRRGKSKGKLSDIFTKLYGRYRKKHKVYDRQRDFHSHRTGFFSNLMAAGVPLHAGKMLMGHIESDMTIVHYDPESYSLPKLHGFVNRIELDISRIARPFAAKAKIPSANVVAFAGSRTFRRENHDEA